MRQFSSLKISRAFTLLELLVVIAIIGLLASIVLASLQSARYKGYDAAIKENLHTIRSQTELYYSSNQHYGPVVSGTQNAVSCPTSGTSIFFTDTAIKAAIDSVAALAPGGTRATCATSPLSGDANAWAVSAPLKYDSPYYWCVDSNGVARRITPDLTLNQYACPQ